MSKTEWIEKSEVQILKHCFVLGISCFGLALSVMADTLVGELPGEFVVNNLGAASYTVPLSISPGTAGVEPKLSVSYSSRGG